MEEELFIALKKAIKAGTYSPTRYGLVTQDETISGHAQTKIFGIKGQGFFIIRYFSVYNVYFSDQI
jgi:hypothetical protein